MSEYKGWTIEVEDLEGNLYGDDVNELDMRESTGKYIALCEAAIEAAYPGAEVSIHIQRGAEGVGHKVFVSLPNGINDVDDMRAVENEEPNIDSIMSGVWERGEEWLVYKAEGED